MVSSVACDIQSYLQEVKLHPLENEMCPSRHHMYKYITVDERRSRWKLTLEGYLLLLYIRLTMKNLIG